MAIARSRDYVRLPVPITEVIQKILARRRAKIREREANQLLSHKATENAPRPLPTAATWQQRTPPLYRVKK